MGIQLFALDRSNDLAVGHHVNSRAETGEVVIFDRANEDKRSTLCQRHKVVEDVALRGTPLVVSRSGSVTFRNVSLTATPRITLTEADCYGVPRLVKTLAATSARVGEPNWRQETATDLAGSVTAANIALYGGARWTDQLGHGVDSLAGVNVPGLVDDPALPREAQADTVVPGIGVPTLGSTGWNYANFALARHRPAQIFELDIRLNSLLVDVGDTVSLTHRRHSFALMTNQINVSPERPATALPAGQQPTLALLIKIVDDPANNKQTLTLYRPMPTLFPAS